MCGQNRSADWEINLENSTENKRAFKTLCSQVTGKLNQRTQNKNENWQGSVSIVEGFYFKIKHQGYLR